MFLLKLEVSAQDETFEGAQKKLKAFKALGVRHGVKVEVVQFGGDNSKSELNPASQKQAYESSPGNL